MKELDVIIAEITIEDYQKDFLATEFALFLLHFGDVYHVVKHINPRVKFSDLGSLHPESEEYNLSHWKAVPPESAFRVLRKFSYQGYPFKPNVSYRSHRHDSLSIKRISKNSPLELTLCGVSIALTVAVIISGGSIEITKEGIKCNLPPLGVGIQKLKEALNKKLDEFN